MKKNKQNLPTCFINLLQINYAAKLQKKRKYFLNMQRFSIRYCGIQNITTRTTTTRATARNTHTIYLRLTKIRKH